MGSFGLVSTYNSVNARTKKSYTAYCYRRHSGGYCQNSKSNATAQFVQLNCRFNEKLFLKAEFGRPHYRYQIPGPLNDSMSADSKASTRIRNHFSPDIYIPSLALN